jgi:hypothetical protein
MPKALPYGKSHYSSYREGMGQLIKELGPPLQYSEGGGPMTMEIFESSQNSFKGSLMGNSIII